MQHTKWWKYLQQADIFFLSLSLSLFGVFCTVLVASCIFQDMIGHGKEPSYVLELFFPLFHHAKHSSPLEEKSRDNLSISSLELATNSTLTIGQGVSQTLIKPTSQVFQVFVSCIRWTRHCPMISTKMLIAIQAVWCTSFRTQSLLYLFASVHHAIQVPNLEASYLKGGGDSLL